MPGNTSPGSFGQSATPAGLAVAGAVGGLSQSAFDVLYGAHASLAPYGVRLTPDGPAIPYDVAISGLSQFAPGPDAIANLQTQMYDGGLLTSQDDITGVLTPKTYSAWKQIVDLSLKGHTAIQTVLDQMQTQGSFSAIEKQITKRLSALEGQIEAPKAVGYTYSDPNALRDQVTAAFTDALGYGPTQSQIDKFVSTIHGGEQAAATAQLSADKQAYVDAYNQMKGRANELRALGPEGLDSFLAAYRHVVAENQQRLGLTGNLLRGPVSQDAQLERFGAHPLRPLDQSFWLNAAQGRTAGWLSATRAVAPTAPASAQPTGSGGGGLWNDLARQWDSSLVGHFVDRAIGAGLAQPNPPANTAALTGPARPLTGNYRPELAGPTRPLTGSQANIAPILAQAGTTGTVPTSAETVVPPQQMLGAQRNMATPSTFRFTAPVYGGIYDLSPSVWSAGVKHLGHGLAERYPTAGTAPESVQTSVASWYANQQFEKYGNWADVASVMSTGQPLAQAGNRPLFGVQGSGMTTNQFANMMVSQVNDALQGVQNALLQPGPTVAVARAAPNPASDAAAMARESDPTGYLANQASYYYGFLNEALYGSPTVQAKDQTGVTGGMAEAAAAPIGAGGSG